MRVVGTFDNRDEWRAARRQGLGASDIYALMGTAPKGWAVGAHTVWRSKVMEIPERDEEHLNMGHLIEPVILAEFGLRQGLHVEHVGAKNLIVARDDLPWAMCSPDGLACEGPYDDDLESCLGPVQAKRATNVYEWEALPAYIADQVMWECFVMGRDMGWVVAEHRQSIGIYEVAVDEIRVKQMTERGRWLWEEHVLTDTEPPLDADEDPTDAWPEEDPGKTMQVDPDLVYRLAQVSANANAWDRKRKDLKKQLQEQMKDAAVGLDGNDEVVRWETIERRGYTVEPTSYRRLDLLVKAEETEETE
jgi:predicted phage-related endonuclease